MIQIDNIIYCGNQNKNNVWGIGLVDSVRKFIQYSITQGVLQSL